MAWAGASPTRFGTFANRGPRFLAFGFGAARARTAAVVVGRRFVAAPAFGARLVVVAALVVVVAGGGGGGGDWRVVTLTVVEVWACAVVCEGAVVGDDSKSSGMSSPVVLGLVVGLGAVVVCREVVVAACVVVVGAALVARRGAGFSRVVAGACVVALAPRASTGVSLPSSESAATAMNKLVVAIAGPKNQTHFLPIHKHLSQSWLRRYI
jgi:hypothetical protein